MRFDFLALKQGLPMVNRLTATLLTVTLIAATAFADIRNETLDAAEGEQGEAGQLMQSVPYYFQIDRMVNGRYIKVGKVRRVNAECALTIKPDVVSGDVLFVLQDWIGTTQTLIRGGSFVSVLVDDHEIRTELTGSTGNKVLFVEDQRSQSVQVSMFQRRFKGEGHCEFRFHF